MFLEGKGRNKKGKETIFHVLEPKRKEREDVIFTNIPFLVLFVFLTFPYDGSQKDCRD